MKKLAVTCDICANQITRPEMGWVVLRHSDFHLGRAINLYAHSCVALCLCGQGCALVALERYMAHAQTQKTTRPTVAVESELAPAALTELPGEVRAKAGAPLQTGGGPAGPARLPHPGADRARVGEVPPGVLPARYVKLRDLQAYFAPTRDRERRVHAPPGPCPPPDQAQDTR